MARRLAIAGAILALAALLLIGADMVFPRISQPGARRLSGSPKPLSAPRGNKDSARQQQPSGARREHSSNADGPRFLPAPASPTGPRPGVSPKRIRALSADLNAANPALRNRAARLPADAGPVALPALEKLVRSGSPEARQRARSAIEEIHRRAKTRAQPGPRPERR